MYFFLDIKYSDTYKPQQNRIQSDNEPPSQSITNHSQGNGHSWASDQSDDSHTVSRDIPISKYSSKNISPDCSSKNNDRMTSEKFTENISPPLSSAPQVEPAKIVSIDLYLFKYCYVLF